MNKRNIILTVVVVCVLALAGVLAYPDTRAWLLPRRAGQSEPLTVLVTKFDGQEQDIAAAVRAAVDGAEVRLNNVNVDIVATEIRDAVQAQQLGAGRGAAVVLWQSDNRAKFTTGAAFANTALVITASQRVNLMPPRTVDYPLSNDRENLAQFALGQIYYWNGRYEQALAVFTRLIEQQPTAGAYLYRGYIYITVKRDIAKLRADCDAALQIDSELAMAHNNRGVIFAIQQNYDAALAEFDQVIELDAQAAVAHSNRGTIYFAQAKYEQARDEYDEAISLDAAYADAYYNRGNLRQLLSEPERAVEDYDRAIALDDRSAQAYNQRGSAYHTLGKIERALEDYDRAIALNPQLGDAFVNRALAYYNLNEYQKAVDDYTLALNYLSPDKKADAYTDRGVAYFHLGEYDRAIADYDSALTLDPSKGVVYQNRGTAYYSKGEYERAINDYDIALAANPESGDAYGVRGLAYEKLGKTEEAKADFEKALELGAKAGMQELITQKLQEMGGGGAE